MWWLIAATDKIDRIRIAKFTTRTLADEYLEKCKSKGPGCIFLANSLLKECVWAKVIFEEDVPLDPKL